MNIFRPQMRMLFSETNQDWQPVPSWVRFLIRLGYDWPNGVSAQRRIALVSMPCDSAAAGLIALGALIRDLGNPIANDVDGHFDALLRYARQYLESCRHCTVSCRPGMGSCDYVARATGLLRHQGRKLYEIFTVSNRPDIEKQSIGCSNSRLKLDRWIFRRSAVDWKIDGEPPPQSIDHEGALPEEAYVRIVAGAQIIPENLQRSFSGLCLAGRVAGGTATHEACTLIRFRSANGDYALSDLLTVREWSPSNVISRMTFFNARTEQFDRRSSGSALVVADGDGGFLKMLGRPEFQRSDVIGVIHRTVERDHLEAVGNRMLGLRQWYAEDSEMLSRLTPTPRGISVLILKRRTP